MPILISKPYNTKQQRKFHEKQEFLENLPYSDGCIEWPWGTFQSGYARVNIKRGQRFFGRRAHRIVCEIYHGPPSSPDLQACHSCHNRKCVNPRHIRWDTCQANHDDKVAIGSQTKGETHGRALLTWAEVDRIRTETRPYKEWAQMFGVSVATIAQVRSGRIWKRR